ncbi:Uncharacterised protein [Streptococcus pyogenes]|nr:Uncharacterised protein [Streptococcus pyogenes]
MKVRVLIEMDDSGRGVRAVNVLDSAMREYNEKLSRSDAAIDFNVLGVVPEAEVRAGVVAEEPEWEYRAVAWELDTENVYDSTRPAPSAGEAIDIAAAQRLLDSNADMPSLVIGVQRRRKAGPWVPVEQETRVAVETLGVTDHNPEEGATDG